MASALLCTTAFLLLFGLASAYSHSTRTPDRVSEADIQRLLHGVMEQLGIARPRVEYPAHQAMNLVGPQSIEGTWLVVNFFVCFRNNYCFGHVSMQNILSLKSYLQSNHTKGNTFPTAILWAKEAVVFYVQAW